MGSEATGSEPSTDSMEEDQVILNCTKLEKTSKFVDADANRLVELWTCFRNEYSRTELDSLDRRLESLLICTSRLIFSVEYTKKISPKCKQDLKEIISSCVEESSDSPSRRRLCKGICTIISNPWQARSFNDFVINSKKEAAKSLWESEGWIVLEKRIDYMTTLFKTPKGLEKLGSALSVLVEKGHEIFQSDTQNSVSNACSTFNPNIFPYQKYVEYLGVYAILHFKEHVKNVNIMKTWSKPTLLDVISSLTDKVLGKDCERIFPKLQLWENIVEVSTKLAKEATWDSLKSENGVLLEEFFKKWMELSKCTSDGMKNPEMESPFDEIVTRGIKDKTYRTDNIFKIVNATIQWVGETPFTRRKCFELFCMAMTRDVDVIENVRTTQQDQIDAIDRLNKKLSLRFLDLAKFFKECPITAKQCLITAFSLNPCPELFNLLFPCSLDEGEKVSIKTDNRDSDIPNNYYDELKEIDFTTYELVMRDLSKDADLDANLRDDLDILLENPRYKGLQTVSKENLVSVCKKLLDSKSVAEIENKKLEHLAVDYEKYKHLKPQWDPEDDGIEKGYRFGERPRKHVLKSKSKPLSKTLLGNAKTKARKRPGNDPGVVKKGRPRKVNVPHSDQSKPVNVVDREAFEQPRQMPNISLPSNPWVSNNITGGFFSEFYYTCMNQPDLPYRGKRLARNFTNEARLINSVKRPRLQPSRITVTGPDDSRSITSSNTNSIEGNGTVLKIEESCPAVEHSETPSNQLVPANSVSQVSTPNPEARVHLPDVSLAIENSLVLANNMLPPMCSFYEDPCNGILRQLVWQYHHFQRQRSAGRSVPPPPTVNNKPTKPAKQLKQTVKSEKKPRKRLMEPDDKRNNLKKPRAESIRSRARKHSDTSIKTSDELHEDIVNSEDKNDCTNCEETDIQAGANDVGDTAESVSLTSPVAEKIEDTSMSQPEPPKPVFFGAFQIMGTYTKGDKPDNTETSSDVIPTPTTPIPIEHQGKSTNIITPSSEQLQKWDATLSCVSSVQVNPLPSTTSLPPSKPVQSTSIAPIKPLEPSHMQKPLKTYSNSMKSKRRLVIKSCWTSSENKRLEEYKSAMPIPVTVNDVVVSPPDQNSVSPAPILHYPSSVASDCDRMQDLASNESTVGIPHVEVCSVSPAISCNDNQTCLPVLHADKNNATIDQVITPQVPEMCSALKSSDSELVSKAEMLPMHIDNNLISHEADFSKLPGLHGNEGSDSNRRKTSDDQILSNGSALDSVSREVDSALKDDESVCNDTVESKNTLDSACASEEPLAQTGGESKSTQMNAEIITVLDANSKTSSPTRNGDECNPEILVKDNQLRTDQSQAAVNKSENNNDAQATKSKQTFRIFPLTNHENMLIRVGSLIARKPATKVDIKTTEDSLNTQRLSPIPVVSLNSKTNEESNQPNSKLAGDEADCGDVDHKKDSVNMECDTEILKEKVDELSPKTQGLVPASISELSNKEENSVNGQSGGTEENCNVDFQNDILAAHQQNQVSSEEQSMSASTECHILPPPPLNNLQNKEGKTLDATENPLGTGIDQFVQDSNDSCQLKGNSEEDNTQKEAIDKMLPLVSQNLAQWSSKTKDELVDTDKLLSTDQPCIEETGAVYEKSGSQNSDNDGDTVSPLPKIEDPAIHLNCSTDNVNSNVMQGSSFTEVDNTDHDVKETIDHVITMVEVTENGTSNQIPASNLESRSAEEEFSTEDISKISETCSNLDKVNTGREYDVRFDTKQKNEDVQLFTHEDVEAEFETTESIEDLTPPTIAPSENSLLNETTQIQAEQDDTLLEETDEEIICLDDDEDDDVNNVSEEPITEVSQKSCEQPSSTKCQEKEHLLNSSNCGTHSKVHQVTSSLLPHGKPDTETPPRPLTPVEKLEDIINTKLKGKKRKRPYEEEDEKIKVASSVVEHARSFDYPLRKLVVCVVEVRKLSPNDDVVSKKVKDQLLSYSVKRSTRLKKKKMRTVDMVKQVFAEPKVNTTDDESSTDGSVQSDSDSDIQIIEEFYHQNPTDVNFKAKLDHSVNASRIRSDVEFPLTTPEPSERPQMKRKTPSIPNSTNCHISAQTFPSKRQKLGKSISEGEQSKEIIGNDRLDSHSNISTEVEDDEDLAQNGVDAFNAVLPRIPEQTPSEHDDDVLTIDDEDADPLAPDDNIVPVDILYDRDDDDEEYDERVNAIDESTTENVTFPIVNVGANFVETVPSAEQNGVRSEQIIGNFQGSSSLQINHSVAKENFVDDDGSSSPDIEIIGETPSTVGNFRWQENLQVNFTSDLSTNSKFNNMAKQRRKSASSSCRSTRLTTEQSTHTPPSPFSMDENSVTQENIGDTQVTDRFSAAANQEPDSNVATNATCLLGHESDEPIITNESIYILPDGDPEQQCYSDRMYVNHFDETETFQENVASALSEDKDTENVMVGHDSRPIGVESSSSSEKTQSSVVFNETIAAVVTPIHENSDKLEIVQSLEESVIELSMTPTLENPTVDDVPVESFDSTEMLVDHLPIASGLNDSTIPAENVVELSRSQNNQAFNKNIDTTTTQMVTITKDMTLNQDRDNFNLPSQEFDNDNDMTQKDGCTKDNHHQLCSSSAESSDYIFHPTTVLDVKEKSQEVKNQTKINEVSPTSLIRHEVTEENSDEISMECHASEERVDDSKNRNDCSTIGEGDTDTLENRDNNKDIWLGDGVSVSNTNNENSSEMLVQSNHFQTGGSDENEMEETAGTEDTNTISGRTKHELALVEENANTEIRECPLSQVPENDVHRDCTSTCSPVDSEENATADKLINSEGSSAETIQNNFTGESELEDIYPEYVGYREDESNVATEEIAGPSSSRESESHVPDSITTLQKLDSPEIPRLTPETDAYEYENSWHSDDEPPLLDNEGEYDCI